MYRYKVKKLKGNMLMGNTIKKIYALLCCDLLLTITDMKADVSD